ncbi:MAG: cobalt ECF transporter T component CbiQ [Candidatus Sulfobium sp.]|jgi:cobalt/nickel transport system permease protein
MANKVPAFLLEKHSPARPPGGRGKMRIPFIERGIHNLASVVKTGYVQWETSSADRFFQATDARVKVLFLLFYVVIVSLKRDLLPEVLIGVFVFVLVLASRLNVFNFYKRVLFFAFLFGFLVTLPAAFNVVTGGEVIFPLYHFSAPFNFWIYPIPAEIGITREGLYSVAMVTSRMANSLALSFFVLLTTPFPEIIRALKVLRVPDALLMVIALAYKYIFVFAKTVEDMHLAKKSRLAGGISDEGARRWIAGRIAVIFRKSRLRSEEAYKAMLARGFSGDVRIHGERKLLGRDWATGIAFLAAGLLFLWI